MGKSLQGVEKGPKQFQSQLHRGRGAIHHLYVPKRRDNIQEVTVNPYKPPCVIVYLDDQLEDLKPTVSNQEEV